MKKIFTLLTALVFSAVAYAQFPSVGILGDAFGGWDEDQDLVTLDGEVYAGVFTAVTGGAKFRQDNDWAIAWGSLDFPTGIGSVDGGSPNIPVLAGNYLVIFNRTTGAYSFQTSFDVTYRVDVSNYTTPIAANGLRVGGNFGDHDGYVSNGPVSSWSPGDDNSAMEDLGNNVWSITVSYPLTSLGDTLYYKFVNGDWGTNEGTDTTAIADGLCGVDDGSGNINRVHILVPGTVCYAWDLCTMSNLADVTENAIANLTVAPNPATDVVNFSFEANNATTVTVTLFDLAGKVVATKTLATSTITSVEMNTTSLQAGSYIYNVVAGDKVATGKLIKQ
jgi:hypothetical protein